MQESNFKTFIRETYNKTSPIPYIITILVAIFVLIHIFELLNSSGAISVDLYSLTVNELSLPNGWRSFIAQPWSLITHPFIYTRLLNLLFDCLWLYWIGNLFLTLLNGRQLWTLFSASIIFGGLIYVIIGSFIGQNSSVSLSWSSMAFGLAAIISSIMILKPNIEFRLFLFGEVKFKVIAIVYLGIIWTMLVFTDAAAAITYLAAIGLGILFITQLQKGNDWSRLFERSSKQKLKIIKNDSFNTKHKTYQSPTDIPNQEQIDQILDKISQKGYENLSSQEKETLFKASKQ